MKKLIVTLSLIITLTALSIISLNQSNQAAANEPINDTNPQLIKQYTITNIIQHDNQPTEYFGQSAVNDNGIYFTSDYISSNVSIDKGDNVSATFANEYDDSLIKVDKQ